MSTFVDIHAIHTLPPSLINRDDTGAPKTAIFGGVPRQRVSSQSWKRAMRKYFEENFGEESIGIRSKRIPSKIAAAVKEIDSSLTPEQINTGLENLFKAAGKDFKLIAPSNKARGDEDDAKWEYPETSYLLFLSNHQIQRAAQEIVAHDGEKFTKKEAEAILNTQHSVDVAAFGRMLADAPNFNVDAAVQVAHALSVHETQPEFDYFTAVDDMVEDAQETGAGMIGTVQMMSSSLYRFAAINVDGLEENLGDWQSAVNAVSYLVEAFVQSMPTGKQNTFANNTLPELVYVVVREGRSVSLVNAFEEPVIGEDSKGRRAASAQALADEEREVESTYGLKPKAAFIVALGEAMRAPFEDLAKVVTFPELTGKVESALGAE